MVFSLITERKDEGGMQWGRASVGFRWRPVFSKRIRLDDISLSNARIDVEIAQDGSTYVSGYLRYRRISRRKTGLRRNWRFDRIVPGNH